MVEGTVGDFKLKLLFSFAENFSHGVDDAVVEQNSRSFGRLADVLLMWIIFLLASFTTKRKYFNISYFLHK